MIGLCLSCHVIAKPKQTQNLFDLQLDISMPPEKVNEKIEDLYLVLFNIGIRCSTLILQVDIAAGGWHSTALTDDGEVIFPFFTYSTFIQLNINL